MSWQPPRPRQLTWEPSLCPRGPLAPLPALWTLLWDASEAPGGTWEPLEKGYGGALESRGGEADAPPRPAPCAHTQFEVIAWNLGRQQLAAFQKRFFRIAFTGPRDGTGSFSPAACSRGGVYCW